MSKKHFTLPYEGGLIEKNLPKGILHNYEKIWTEIYAESRPASYAVADLVVDAIKATPEGRLFRLGLTTGTTPTSLYNELARRPDHRHHPHLPVQRTRPPLPGRAGFLPERGGRLH